MNNSTTVTDKEAIDQLTDMLVETPTALEIFGQIYAAKEGKSAFDIKVTSPSGEDLAYSSIHRWVKILKEKRAIRVARRIESKKGGTKILYNCTPKGERAYYLAIDYISKKSKAAQRLLERAKKESGQFAGLGAPDLLKEALELAGKKMQGGREPSER